MKAKLVELLVCPRCSGKLTLHTFRLGDDEVEDGVFTCAKCNRLYPIVGFIPRMLSPHLYHNPGFFDKYSGILGRLGSPVQCTVDKRESLGELKKDTIEKFGFEWLEYGRFGWDDPLFHIGRERDVFRRKSLLDHRDLCGKLVLDAGCGNGRYSYWATQYGAEVVGVDLGHGVESAYKNARTSKNVHIIQGDIFNLPFPKGMFDVVFSIGVLMHTGDARLALMSLAEHLKVGGSISFHLYHKGNPVYELNDFLLRAVTTRLPIRQLVRFTKLMLIVARCLDQLNVLKYINLLLRLENHPHCIFDWYAAPVATHHTYSEVYAWCRDFGLEVVKDCNTDERSRLVRKVSPVASLTVCAKKKGAI